MTTMDILPNPPLCLPPFADQDEVWDDELPADLVDVAVGDLNLGDVVWLHIGGFKGRTRCIYRRAVVLACDKAGDGAHVKTQERMRGKTYTQNWLTGGTWLRQP